MVFYLKKESKPRTKKSSKLAPTKVPFWAIAWIFLVVALHYVFSYLFDPKYSAFVEKLLSRFFG